MNSISNNLSFELFFVGFMRYIVVRVFLTKLQSYQRINVTRLDWLLQMMQARVLIRNCMNSKQHTLILPRLKVIYVHSEKYLSTTTYNNMPFTVVCKHWNGQLFILAAPRVTGITEDGCLVEWSPVKMLPSQGELHYRVQLTKVRESDSKIVSPIKSSILWINNLFFVSNRLLIHVR